MYVVCGSGMDEDGNEYLTLTTMSGEEVRLHYVKYGEEITNGFMQYIRTYAFGPRKDGSIAISLLTNDRRSRQAIYRVPQESVITEAELNLTLDHC